MEFLYVLLIIFVVFGLSFILMNIRHIVTGKEFRGTCATNSEFGECSCSPRDRKACKNKKTTEDAISN